MNISLRDIIALEAMKIILQSDGGLRYRPETLSSDAYKIADAMLLEKEQKTEQDEKYRGPGFLRKEISEMQEKLKDFENTLKSVLSEVQSWE